MAPVVQTLRVLIITLAAFLFSLESARAATITVNSLAQEVTLANPTGIVNGNCTLGEAILAANNDAAVDGCTAGSGDDTIVLPAGVYTLSVAASFGSLGDAIGLPQVTSNIIIQGQDTAAFTIIERPVAAPAFRIFEQSGFLLGTLTIRRVTIRGGKSTNHGGGAIFAGGNGLIVEDAAFENNSTTAGDGGGAIHTANPPPFPVPVATTLTISGSTFEGNTAANFAGALLTQALTSTIKNSTFSGNSAAWGGAIATALAAGTLNFNNVTITGNHASNLAGGIFDPNSLFGPSPTQFNFRNTILAGNTATGGSPECAAVLNSQGHNIVQQDVGCTIIIGAAVGDLFGVNPLLGALANNGGGTKTHALLLGSPAIEGGDPGVPGSGGTACEATDQRGVARPIDGNINGIAVCDVGAFEAAEGSAAAVIVVNESIIVSDAPQVTPPAVINVAEIIQVSDAPMVTPPAVINLAEIILVSDAPTVLPAALINVSESIVVSDDPNLLPAALIAINESINVSDAPKVVPPAIIAVAEVIKVSDAPTLITAPKIIAFNPTSGPVGTIVTITGSNFTGTTVKFNGVNAIFTVDSPTQITATVPSGATTGPISVTTPGGTAVSATNFTVLNTPVGNNVGVQPVDSTTGNKPVTLTFSNVTQTGFTSLTTSSSGPPPPKGFKLGNPPVYFDLTTTALFSGAVKVCINYSGITFRNPLQIKLFHLENGVWVDRTVSVDTVNKIICASVTSLSPFAIFELDGRPVIAVTNQNDDTVSIIDPETNQVVDTVAVGHKPTADTFFDLIFDSFAPPAKLYVAERGNGKEQKGKEKDKDDGDDDDEEDDGRGVVQVLVGPSSPTDTNAFDFNLGKAIKVGKRPEGMAPTPDGAQLWVTNRNDNSISIIDRATEIVIATVPLKKNVPSKGKGKGSQEIKIGQKPLAIGFSPDGLYAYVVGRNSNNLIVLDALNAASNPANAILGYVDVGNKPVALAVSATSSLVYVVNRSQNNLAVVDVNIPASPVVRAKRAVGEEPEGLALLHDGSKLYVTNSESNTVSVLQVQSGSPYLTLIANIPVGKKPSGIALTPPGTFSDQPFAYVANRKDNTVSVIDTTIDQVIATIPVGKGPKGVAAGLLPTTP